MDDCQADDGLKVEGTERVLSTTSGNIQVIPEYVKLNNDSGGENFLSLGGKSSQEGCHDEKHHLPAATLIPHDGRDAEKTKRAFENVLYRFRLSLVYHQLPKYREYRRRARKDVDKDGNIIWTDIMEEAFSNALIVIPPMGRSKRSQHGVLFGRNMLIQEWILHATGVVRNRKQISSHIQVLDTVFKHWPDWKRVTRVPAATSSRQAQPPEPELFDYYTDSVADMVRYWPTLRKALFTALQSGVNAVPLPPVLRSNDANTHRHPLKGLEFEMWIGPSTNVDKSLHNFTRFMDHGTFTRNSLQLDDIPDWRCRYPDLQEIIGNFRGPPSCDVILLDTYLEMMTDFPLEPVKLGINFQLEFGGADCPFANDIGCLESYSCITRMYQDGQLLRQTDVDECQITGHGKVKPPFESKWWAQEFVHQTDRFRMAEDSGNEHAVATAAEATRAFFQSLSIMQEISTGCAALSKHSAPLARAGRPHRQIAILLWTFSQSDPDHAPLTIPRKLIMPFRSSTDTKALLASFDESGDLTGSSSSEAEYPIHSSIFDTSMMSEYTSDAEELCQDGSMALAQRQQRCGLDPMMHIGSKMSHGTVPSHPPLASLEQMGSTQDASNVFLYPAYFASMQGNRYSQIGLDSSQHSFNHEFPQPDDCDGIDTLADPRQTPLQKFDSSTHDNLQAQLAGYGSAADAYDHHSPPSAYAQSCASQDGQHLELMFREVPLPMKELSVVSPAQGPGYLRADEIWQNFNLDVSHVNANLAAGGLLVPGRPALQHHHTFAGVSHAEDSLLDTPRKTYTRLIEHMELENHSGAIDHDVTASMNPTDFVRSHSQPPPDVRMDSADVLMSTDDSSVAMADT